MVKNYCWLWWHIPWTVGYTKEAEAGVQGQSELHFKNKMGVVVHIFNPSS